MSLEIYVKIDNFDLEHNTIGGDTYRLQVHDVRESLFEGHNNISNTSVW